MAELLLAVTSMVPSPSLAAAVRRRSGGNPFFVRELARLVLTVKFRDPGDRAHSSGRRNCLGESARIR